MHWQLQRSLGADWFVSFVFFRACFPPFPNSHKVSIFLLLNDKNCELVYYCASESSIFSAATWS